MNTDQLGSIALDINLKLIRQGLTDAEVSFVGMTLMSYAIGSTMAGIIKKGQDLHAKQSKN